MSPVLLAALVLAGQALGARPAADSLAALRRAARAAEVRHERLARRLAPWHTGGFDGSSCDEIVGRFCLRYDQPGKSSAPPPAEAGPIIDSRREAIEALRGLFARIPGEFEVAGPLVRYLVEDDRAAEAVPAARLYRAVSGDEVWGPLLEGFALEASGDAAAAGASFDEALGRMPEPERAPIEDLDWILERSDRSFYRGLAPGPRATFEHRFWRFADPLYLTPGNEARTEHIARHVWSRILARAPLVAGMLPWGRDLEQLTVRFGPPVAHSRLAGRIGSDDATVDHFDSRQLAYVPESLADGVPPTPLPGRPWELARPQTRAGHAPRGVPAVRYLPHQVSLFPSPEGATVRVDAAWADSVLDPARPLLAAWWLLDPDGGTSGSGALGPEVRNDTVFLHAEFTARPGEWVYAVEILGDSAAARARYSFEVRPTAGAPALSDPVLLLPFRGMPAPADREAPAFRPRAGLQLRSTDTIGAYIEATGLRPGAPFRFRLSLQKAGRSNLPARLVRWIGRRIGLGSDPDPVFLEWDAAADHRGAAVLAFELPLARAGDGDRVLVARLTESGSGRAAESRRILRVGPFR